MMNKPAIMDIQQNISLKLYNTFRIEASAKYFSSFSSVQDLEEIWSDTRTEERMILGGGSNVLFSRNYNGIVLKNDIAGMDIVKEDEHHVYVKAGAGENWHSFVLFCLDRNLAGVENLSLIPGNVGAAPMQNIGAYGAELKDVFYELEAYHLKDKHAVHFTTNDCRFGYRDSVFKNKYRDQFAILNVTFRLNKIPHYNTSYGAIEQELKKMSAQKDIRTIAQAVIHIRRSKLPDPQLIGNAGSFFKNPVVPEAKYNLLKEKHPSLPGYPQEDGRVKLAAAWLIEKCGWKGYRKGDAGCHEKQALVLVNYGNARGNEIYELSEEIKQTVLLTFQVELEREVNVV